MAAPGGRLRKYLEPLPAPGRGNLPPTPFWAYDDGSGLGGQAGSFGMAVPAQSGTPVRLSGSCKRHEELRRSLACALPEVGGKLFMREIAYAVRGFLTVRRDSLRVPLNGSLTIREDPDSGLFTGDLVLRESAISRTILGASVLSATVQVTADSPVIGVIGGDGQMFATVTVNAVIDDVRTGGRTLMSGGSCRTSSHAVVPIRSRPGFELSEGGRLVGRYHRPPFTGCGRITPLVNLLVAGPGNAVVIDLIPVTS